jgi:hypothetical protein
MSFVGSSSCSCLNVEHEEEEEDDVVVVDENDDDNEEEEEEEDVEKDVGIALFAMI